MPATALFDHGDPLYQPALSHGFRYREPTSESSRTSWVDCEEQDVDRDIVARAIGVDVADLIRWENATDLEAEGEGRAEHGDW